MKLLIIVLVFLGVSACTAVPLQNDAKLVRLTNTEPAHETCKFLGDVTGNQGDFLTGEFTSNAELETGARNDIKNKAYNLGGNLVYLLTQRAGQTGSFDKHFGGSSVQTNVTLSGNVYYCPES
jgi:hypothetical protein